MSNKLSWFEIGMNAWRHVIQVSERTLIDNVAATVPWLAPVSPAFMIWNNAVHILLWPVWVAWVLALAVEGLGLSVVSTAFQLWKEKRNTFWIAVVTTVFYLSVIITVNVALELGAPTWVAKALLSLLSVPAAVTIALRTQNAQALEQEQIAAIGQAEAKKQTDERAERLKAETEARALQQRIELEDRALRLKVEAEEREHQRTVDSEERERRHALRMLKSQEKVAESFLREKETYRKVTEDEEELTGKFPNDWRKARLFMSEPEVAEISGMQTAQIVKKYHLASDKSARNWREYARTEMAGKEQL